MVGGINWEAETDISTPLYTKQITNKDYYIPREPYSVL